MRLSPPLSTFALIIASLGGSGCSKTGEVSRQQARVEVEDLAKVASTDVEEVRKGLPLGAHQLEAFFADDKAQGDAAAAKEALDRARGKVQDLRTAKSTFFALADKNGLILRSDLEHDALASKNLFAAFDLKAAAGGRYAEARGSMPEAAGVRGRGDGQWAAAAPVLKGSDVVGLYATGWSWSAYAYRLENHLRSRVRSEAVTAGAKEPLVYVYVVVEKAAYGAPISPEVNAKAVQDSGLMGRASGEAVVDTAQEIEGRDFGIALRRVPALGSDVAIAVVRSET
jgi:polyhydroxyalkanoate synthesis regulator phasin